jgi:hypothetical protein
VERLVAEFVAEQKAGEDPPQPVKPAARSQRRRRLALVGAGSAVVAVAAYASLRLGREPAPPVAVQPTLTTLPPDPVYPPPATEPVEAESEGLVLTISARENCWVAVEVDGAPVLNRTLRRGETEVVEAEGEIVLSVGNAGGLAFKVNDRRGLSLGADGEVRKNIVITRQSLSSLVEEAPPVRTSHSS